MPYLPAAILVFPDRPHPQRQGQIALAFADTHGLTVVAVCPSAAAAAALVAAGLVTTVISALAPADRGAIEQTGAQLFVLRQPAPKRRTVDRLISRLTATGLDTQQISTALELDPTEVRRVRRRNIRPTRNQRHLNE